MCGSGILRRYLQLKSENFKFEKKMVNSRKSAGISRKLFLPYQVNCLLTSALLSASDYCDEVSLALATPKSFMLSSVNRGVGSDTGTIPLSMRQHAEDFVCAAFDIKEGAGDGSRLWCINTWGLSSIRKRAKKRKSPAAHPP